jgi:cell fate (sporulation/competence/biofilm development) regulator YlbF (YheA/YmcA/DUF963 family)
MNVYDKVNELARVLKTTPEVIEYKNAFEKINLNPTNKKMVDDFREKQLELYSLQMQGKEPEKEQLEKANKLWSVINLNSEVREYFEAEMKFSRLWEDIMKILGDAVNINMSINA